MKKINNGKFRNGGGNNNNAIYSLNYKFDSICSAGKFSGTALDLIKKYNELAKEAHSNGDYVEMEVFRQYAEHYRKIVTEINERKNQPRGNTPTAEAQEQPAAEAPVADNGLVETEAAEPAPQPAEASAENTADKPQVTMRRRRSFTIVEVSDNNAAAEAPAAAPAETNEKPHRRTYTRRPRAAKAADND